MQQGKLLSGVSSVSLPGPQGMSKHFEGGHTNTEIERGAFRSSANPLTAESDESMNTIRKAEHYHNDQNKK